MNLVARSMASSTDPIQSLFLEKIRDHSSKSKNAPEGLVDADQALVKSLKAEMDRVANVYGIKDADNLADLGLKFDDTMQLDSINLRK